MLARDSRKVYYGLKESQQKSTTRETLQARSSAADCPTTMRPPPTGEDSNDSERSKGNFVASLKSDSLVSSPRMTPRRVSKKESIATRGYSGLESDEEKLAPMGFEPEGSAASTPQCERWPSTLNDMLIDCQGFKSFYQFLKQENSEILLDFWRASESFKRMAPISHEMRTTAKAIFQKFIFPVSCNALEVSDTTRMKIAQHVNDQPVDCGLFEEAISEILANLKNNHYPRFMNTTLYKECIQSGGESPQGICERFTHTARFHGGYLPTLPEEKVLGFDEFEDDGDQFEFEQHRKSAKGLSHCAKRSGSDELDARCLLHVPMNELLSPYHYPTVPVGSRIESENQSLSSDAMTEDTLSVTTDSCLTDDTSSRCSGRRKCSARSKKFGYHDGLPMMQFVPRTQRIPKEACNPKHPEEFAKILIEKLEKVKLQRELDEREAHNLSTHYEAPRKSILQQAIDNTENKKKLYLTTMAKEAVASFKEPYYTDTAVAGVETVAASTTTAPVAVSTCNSRQVEPQQIQRTKQPTVEKREAVMEARSSEPTVRDGNVWEARPQRRDDDIPFMTVNHHRIIQWMKEGEQAQQGSKESKSHRHHSSSTRNSSRGKMSTASSTRQSEKNPSLHLPDQPIASDPMMPPLPAPHASSVLEETRRRLINMESGGERRSKYYQKQRSQAGPDFETTSCREKTSASSCCSTKDYSSYGQGSGIPHERHCKAAPSVTGISSVSHADSISTCKDSGFCGSVSKKKDKHGSLTITYWLWREPIPYRTSLPVKCVTLGQFKDLLPPRKGSYRFYFKSMTGDKDCLVVWEEVKDDSTVLPTYDGQVVGKVERVDS